MDAPDLSGRIVGAEVVSMSIPLRRRLRRSSMSGSAALLTREVSWLRLRGDDDAQGIGEASAVDWLTQRSSGAALRELHDIAAQIVGVRPLASELLARSFDPSLSCSVRAGLQCALLDLEARRRGISLARLLGAAADATLAVSALLACWWLVHVAHVERLVRRRTADLKAANAELSRQMLDRERAEELSSRHRAERDQFSRLGILGEMSSNMAHELNQPLAACINYAKGMRRMLDAGQADPTLLAEGVDAVAEQAERAAAIIQRIRGFVRRRPPQRGSVDINEVVRETVDMFRSLTGRKGLAIHLHLMAEAPRVIADKVEVQQVLLNLLQNAVDAMVAEDGGITVRVSASDGVVKVAVRDAGPGLSAEAAAHLFEPFFTTKPEGLGLGLSICRTIVESHGGRLWAAANDGRGLTMRFTLPIEGAQ